MMIYVFEQETEQHVRFYNVIMCEILHYVYVSLTILCMKFCTMFKFLWLCYVWLWNFALCFSDFYYVWNFALCLCFSDCIICEICNVPQINAILYVLLLQVNSWTNTWLMHGLHLGQYQGHNVQIIFAIIYRLSIQIRKSVANNIKSVPYKILYINYISIGVKCLSIKSSSQAAFLIQIM